MSHFLVLTSADSTGQVEEIMNYCYSSKFDSYELGGAWTELFLVSDANGCGWSDVERQHAPVGYFWTPFAKKKDIAWEEMRKIKRCPLEQTSAFIQNREWHDIKTGKTKLEAWGFEVKAFIDSVAPDDLLFGIDCHGCW